MQAWFPARGLAVNPIHQSNYKLSRGVTRKIVQVLGAELGESRRVYERIPCFALSCLVHQEASVF